MTRVSAPRGDRRGPLCSRGAGRRGRPAEMGQGGLGCQPCSPRPAPGPACSAGGFARQSRYAAPFLECRPRPREERAILSHGGSCASPAAVLTRHISAASPTRLKLDLAGTGGGESLGRGGANRGSQICIKAAGGGEEEAPGGISRRCSSVGPFCLELLKFKGKARSRARSLPLGRDRPQGSPSPPPPPCVLPRTAAHIRGVFPILRPGLLEIPPLPSSLPPSPLLFRAIRLRRVA